MTKTSVLCEPFHIIFWEALGGQLVLLLPCCVRCVPHVQLLKLIIFCKDSYQQWSGTQNHLGLKAWNEIPTTIRELLYSSC